MSGLLKDATASYDIIEDLSKFEIAEVDGGANWGGVLSGIGHVAGGGALVVAGVGIAGGSGGVLAVGGGVVAGFGAAGVFFGVCEIATSLAE